MNSFGLYIHIPYCIKKCPYCDFNSYGVGRVDLKSDEIMPEENYTKALITELNYYANNPDWNKRPLHSIFFGGGTPSLFSTNSIREIIENAKENFPFQENIEITLEANPGTIQEELGINKLKEFKDAGINRISMGVQGFNENKLKFLGRLHSKEDVVSAVANIKAAGFENFNLDLIFGIAEESLADWENDLNKIIEFNPQHISCYCLTIEAGTDFGKLHKKGKLKVLEDDLQAKMFELTQATLNKAGYLQYEISNYAKAGAECQHNLGYWQGYDYLGLGAGAHSYFQVENNPALFGKRWRNLPGPEDYLSQVISKGHAAHNKEEIDQEKARLEYLFLAFRTKLGFDLVQYQEKFLIKNDLSYIIQKLDKENLITSLTENIYTPTAKGLLFVDEILKELV